MGKAKVTDAQIAEALINSFGIQSQAIAYIQKKYGCRIKACTLSNRIHGSDKLQEARQAGTDKMGDIAESKLFKLVNEGNLKAIMYYLNSKCRDRGYGVKTYEMSGINGNPIQTENKTNVQVYLPENGR